MVFDRAFLQNKPQDTHGQPDVNKVKTEIYAHLYSMRKRGEINNGTALFAPEDRYIVSYVTDPSNLVESNIHALTKIANYLFSINLIHAGNQNALYKYDANSSFSIGYDGKIEDAYLVNEDGTLYKGYNDIHWIEAIRNYSAAVDAIPYLGSAGDIDILVGGGRRYKKATATGWSPTKAKVTCRDGVMRTVFVNQSKPGDKRVKKIINRGNKKVVAYVKP